MKTPTPTTTNEELGICKRCKRACIGTIDLGDAGTITPPYCEECSKQVEAERRRERFEEHMTLSGLDRELWSYDRDIGNVELLDWCLAHAGGWIWLGGETGVGKTRALARAVCVDTWKRKSWPSIHWVESSTFFLQLAEYGSRGRQEAKENLERARNAGLLVVDDIGQERLTDTTRAMLFSLVDFRYRRQKRTWFSSNANGEELLAHIGPGRWPQVLRRIAERGYVRTWTGTKWEETTRKAGAGEGTYWWQDM